MERERDHEGPSFDERSVPCRRYVADSAGGKERINGLAWGEARGAVRAVTGGDVSAHP
ncbi:hypothetical protein [Streptomyces sp. NPDC045470]|uniref:hypothetical protein n=1 Tax=unclassified Streptomyces TaxID=2593676 RepID=UPI003406CB13